MSSRIGVILVSAMALSAWAADGLDAGNVDYEFAPRTKFQSETPVRQDPDMTLRATMTTDWDWVRRQENYPEKLFSVSQLHFDANRGPHGFDWYLRSREGQTILKAIAAYYGVNPAYVTLAMNALPSASIEGEETHYQLPVAKGYAYCASRVAVMSIVPADGPRGSVVNATATPGGLNLDTWTPVRGLGEGDSWAEGDAQVVGIIPAYLKEFTQKGICASPGSGTPVISCRGKTCGEAMHGKLENMRESAPELARGF